MSYYYYSAGIDLFNRKIIMDPEIQRAMEWIQAITFNAQWEWERKWKDVDVSKEQEIIKLKTKGITDGNV